MAGRVERAVAPAEHAAQPGSAFVRIKPMHRMAIVGGFAAFLTLVTFFNFTANTPGGQWVVPALGFMVGVSAIPFLFHRPEYGWLHPMVFQVLWNFLQLLLKFPSFAWGLDAHIALPGYGPERLGMLTAGNLALQGLGYLAYYCAFWIGRTPPLPKLYFGRPKAMATRAYVVLGISAAIMYVYLQRQGGLNAHILSWAQTRHVAVAGEHYWIMGTRLALYAVLLWLAARPGAAKQPAFIAAAAGALMLAFLGTGSRSAVIYPVLMGLMAYMLRRGRVIVTRGLVVALAGLVFMTSFGTFRRSMGSGVVDWEIISNADPALAIEKAVSGELVERKTTREGVMPILAKVPGEVDMLYGRSYFAVLTLPVPRALWPDKPGLVDGRVGRTFFGTTGGVPAGSVGEAFWNFHIPGVVIAFFLLGILHKWFMELYLRHRGRTAVIVLYVTTVFLSSASGPLLADYLIAVVSAGAIAVASGMLSIRSPRSRAR